MRLLVRPTRLILDAIIVIIVVGSIILAGISIIGPRVGYSPVVLRGNSMAPTAPVGSLVIVQPVAPADLAVDDIITFKTDRDIYVTHRITRLVERPDGLYLETKGDANATADPQIFAATYVTGRAVAWWAGLGFVFDIAAVPSLWLAIVGLLVSLYMAGSMLDGIAERWATERRLGAGSAA